MVNAKGTRHLVTSVAKPVAVAAGAVSRTQRPLRDGHAAERIVAVIAGKATAISSEDHRAVGLA